jgi:hypothetical protein
MEELLENCQRLCCGSFRERARAYHLLKSSRAFAMVLYHLRGFQLTSYEVARLLAEGGTDPIARSARRLLEQQFDRQEQRPQAS